jgi:ubiquinone/menaquinone biosynthesis C-methylase UbiE
LSSSREIDRLTSVYREYLPGVAGRWSPENRGNRIIQADLQRRIARLLRGRSLLPLDDCGILEVGCGSGYFLAVMEALGASAANLHGIDLLPERIEVARSRYPNFDLRVGNAEELPYAPDSFDLVMVFTVFTSILEPEMRGNVAAEMSRVLRTDGAILWYDFRYNNPWNPHVSAVRRAEVAKLFPGFDLHLETITLVPQLARRLGPLTTPLYRLLASVPPLRTHFLGLLARGTST